MDFIMTMHLEHPALTINGKKKGKQKFRSADAARKAREQQDEWEKLKQRWNVPSVKTKQTMKPLKISYSYRGQGEKIKSHGDGVGVATAKEQQMYTGNNIIGIGTMHKSNAVPIFSPEQAQEISSMRR